MNFLRVCLVMLLSSVSLSALAPGDDLGAFWKAQGARYTSARVLGPLPGWPGYESAVLATDAAFSRAPFVLVVRGTGTVIPFGTVEAPDVLVLDTDGDGLADIRTARNMVPGWVPLKIPGPRGDGKAFQALADRLYRQYNQVQGPVPAQLQLIVDEVRRRGTDLANRDRDLESALMFALDQGAAEPAVGIGTLAALAQALRSRGGIPPLVYLFLGEALETGGLVDEAQSSYQRILDADPRSLIGAYKKARVDATALAAFRKAHPDFWALRN